MRAVFSCMTLAAATLSAQIAPPPAPWRGAGPTPCTGSDGGIYHCPPALHDIAIQAGRVFDSRNGQLLTGQTILISNGRIAEIGPASQIRIPAGAERIDLSRATV